jgi:hypothetical protein
MQCLRNLVTIRGSKNELKLVNFDKIRYEKVKYIPPTFDGEVVFELPPPSTSSTSSIGKHMDGMDKKYDGHTWCRTKTSNIRNDWGLTFRRATCVGHLQCQNKDCDFLSRSSRMNETEWEGNIVTPFSIGMDPPLHSTITCKICNSPPVCLATCNARMYYIFSRGDRSRVCVHLGHHEHPVSDGICRETLDKISSMLQREVARTPQAKISAITLSCSKEMLDSELVHNGEGPKEKLTGQSLEAVMDKYELLASPSVRNNIVSLKHTPGKTGVIDSIMALKDSSKIDFIHGNIFPGQGKEKVFLFKMLTEGDGSGVDLIKRIQPGGNLENSWIMFDHVKRVKNWTTMACHVYDSAYCKVMTIAVCDMQSEDTAAQCIMWRSLNEVMAANGVANVNFKGFMADSAQANWNAVRTIYGTGDPKQPMENRERTCLLHWTTSLNRHTQKFIKPDMQFQHNVLCKQYKNSKCMEEAETRYLAIRAWWLSSGAASEDAIRELDLWLAFWHFRYRQWGGFMQMVCPLLLSLEIVSLYHYEAVINLSLMVCSSM